MHLGFGIAFLNNQKNILAAYYPNPLGNDDDGIDVCRRHKFFGFPEGLTVLDEKKRADILSTLDSEQLKTLSAECTLLTESGNLARRVPILWYGEKDAAPYDVAGAYLKLHLLSARKYKPHAINMAEIFKVLPNNAWTNVGPINPDDVSEMRLSMLLNNQFLEVFSLDKFPKMTDFVVPSGVRIADTARVRLGAYVGEHTTIMHEGFINFNAGTDGPNMIEGRISSGVFVQSGSDLGGGCSTMGTLSGGGSTVISVGKNCLIGANGGIGISLGDGCTVESGLYVTSGTVVSLLDKDKNSIAEIKARELSGKDNLLFRRHSQTGRVECLTKKNTVELNNELHRFN